MLNRCPCTPECQRRNAFCRLTCPEGQAYEQRQQEKRRLEYMRKEADSLLSEGAARAVKHQRLHGVKGK